MAEKAKKAKRKNNRERIRELEAENDRLMLNLKTLGVNDELYKQTQEAISANQAIIDEIKDSTNRRSETIQRIACGVTVAGCSVAGLALSYRQDKSEDIMKNKGVFGWFNKIFKT